MLPLAFKLTGKRVLVLGAGRVAAAKLHLLCEAGADVTVIASEVLTELPGPITLIERAYQWGDLEGFQLVVSATGNPPVNDEVVAEARERNIWLNVVDDPERCDFYFTAVHRDGPIIVSVSSQGSAPAMAQYVRDTVRDALPEGLGLVARQVRAERDAMHEQGLSTEDFDWRTRIHQLVDELVVSSAAQ